MLVAASITVLLLTAVHHATHTHPVTNLEVLDCWTNLSDVTNNFMPAIESIICSPFL